MKIFSKKTREKLRKKRKGKKLSRKTKERISQTILSKKDYKTQRLSFKEIIKKRIKN